MNGLPTPRTTLRIRYVTLLAWCKGGCRHPDATEWPPPPLGLTSRSTRSNWRFDPQSSNEVVLINPRGAGPERQDN